MHFEEQAFQAPWSGPSSPSRLDASHAEQLRRLIGVDLLIIDDLALQPMDGTETADFYELVVQRHHRSSTLLTSNRDPRE